MWWVFLHSDYGKAISSMDQPRHVTSNENSVHLSNTIQRCDASATNRMNPCNHITCANMITKFRSRLEQTLVIGEVKTLGIRWHSQPSSWLSMNNGLVSKYSSVA